VQHRQPPLLGIPSINVPLPQGSSVPAARWVWALLFCMDAPHHTLVKMGWMAEGKSLTAVCFPSQLSRDRDGVAVPGPGNGLCPAWQGAAGRSRAIPLPCHG